MWPHPKPAEAWEIGHFEEVLGPAQANVIPGKQARALSLSLTNIARTRIVRPKDLCIF